MRVYYLMGIISILLLAVSNIEVGGEEASVTGIPGDGRLINPLRATINVTDPENATITWFLDGEEIGTGTTIQRYVYPGLHNLTVKIEYDNGTIISRTFELDPVPPPGWEEEPDNRKNRIIFWLIFGSGGIVFAAFAAWLWLKKDDKDPTNLQDQRIKVQ